MRAIALAALAYVLAVRALELALSRRNRSRVLRRGGHAVVPDGFGRIALVHGAWTLGLVAEELVLGPTLHSAGVRAAAALVFLLSELGRAWCIRALGERWNVRVVVAPEPPVRRGPYAFARHPNYVAAAVGLVALPLALGLVWTALFGLVAKPWALARRLRLEEEALEAARAD